MPMANQYVPEKRIFALFASRSGDGKSTAAASFPGRVLDLDFDYRFAGIAGAIKQNIIKGDDIEFQQFNPHGGWEPVDKLTMQLDQYRLDYQRTGKFPYGTIIVDSLTSLARLLVLTSHQNQSGKKIGMLRISGPGDFNFEASGVHQFFDYLRTFPCNIICNAHVIQKYGKLDKTKEYSETGVVGEKLSVRDNLGENVLTYFDNVFRFSREAEGVKSRYFVEFSTDMAKNNFGIPPGKYEITGKAFYPFLQELIVKYNS